jgi:hypothetical protein
MSYLNATQDQTYPIGSSDTNISTFLFNLLLFAQKTGRVDVVCVPVKHTESRVMHFAEIDSATGKFCIS